MDGEARSRERLLRHRYGELVEGIAVEESLVTRAMFHCLACYLHGRLKLALADREPPWDGILVPTSPEHHAALRRSIPTLRVHPVLGKWLYLPASVESFEDDVQKLVDLALADDPSLGVEPRSRRPRTRRPRAGRRSRRRIS